jgi:hypothetical protein
MSAISHSAVGSSSRCLAHSGALQCRVSVSVVAQRHLRVRKRFEFDHSRAVARDVASDVELDVAKNQAAEAISGVLVTGGVFLICGSGSLFLYQCVLWLRDGFWTVMTMRTFGTQEPDLPLRGLQKMIGWVLDEPSSLVFLVLGIAAIAIGVSVANDFDST